MNYNFNDALKAKDSGNFLSPGIKNATFKGVELGKVTSQKNGNTYKTLSLKLDIEGYGEYTQNFFEPESSERTEGQYGPNASQLDHFLIIVREILEAVNPKIIEDIDSGKEELTGTFNKVVNTVKDLTDPFVGKVQVQVKLIPQNNGFASMPSYPARIDRNGNLAISTRIIGHNLTLTPRELKQIEASKNAKPTNMASKVDVKDTLEEMDKNIDAEEDDLPF